MSAAVSLDRVQSRNSDSLQDKYGRWKHFLIQSCKGPLLQKEGEVGHTVSSFKKMAMIATLSEETGKEKAARVWRASAMVYTRAIIYTRDLYSLYSLH